MKPESDSGIEHDRRMAAWSVAIMTSREPIGVLSQTIEAAVAAASGRDCIVDVVVNGNGKLADEAAQLVRSLSRGSDGTTVRVWHLALGDKAHCINECIHRIWQGSDVAFFVDGYAQIKSDALTALADALGADPHALAATGVPTVGRSAAALRRAMQVAGGMHGTLFAVRKSAMEEMRRRGFRLPLGMYRTDGTMAAVFCFGFDPEVNEWDPKRIAICGDATWDARTGKLLSYRDVAAQFNRQVRLAWGAFISKAVQNHLAVRRRRPETFPDTAVDLVRAWTEEFPIRALTLAARKPLVLLALWRARQRKDWRERGASPQLLAEVRISKDARGSV